MSRSKLCLAGALLFVFSLIAWSCTSLPQPERRISQSETYLDWGRTPPDAAARAKHQIEGTQPFEWWYIDAHLDNGQTVVGVFLDPSFTTAKPALTLSLYERDWSKAGFLRELSPAEITTSPDDAGVTTPYGFLKRVDDRTYHVRWEFEGLTADLKFIEEAPGWLPGGADGVNGDNLYFFWTVHQARSRVEGTITRGGQSYHVSGQGYADHNWGKKALNEIVRSWIWGRIFAGPYTIIYADVDYYDPAIKSRPLYLARGREVLIGAGSPTITQDDFAFHPGLKRYFPRSIRIEFREGPVKADIRIRFKGLVEEVDLLSISGRNALTQWIARTFVARPTYFRVMAEFDGTIEQDGRAESIAGDCLYEVMGFI
ncbi:MAG: hypothetical protein V1816_21610 [Pseudomonadota bacterium]